MQAGEAAAQVIDLHEREVRVFPREEFFDSLGQSLLLPETRELTAVDLRDVAAGIELRVMGVIGYLPVTKGITLNLRPKFPMENFWAMLERADETYERVLPTLRSYEYSNTIAPHQLLARSFCFYLRNILDSGIARGYYPEPYRGYYRPKINFGQTISMNLARGDNLKVASDVFSFSANLYPNQLIKSACISFLQVMPHNEKWKDDRRVVTDALNTLHLLPAARMRMGDQYFSDSLPAWIRSEYLGALTVYSILLGHQRVGFTHSVSGHKLPSFLFSLDYIFESYIRNSFRIALGGPGVSVLDGNTPRYHFPLFKDNKTFPVKSDLIFKTKGKVLGIGEVKYKPKIDENGRYQLISHVLAHNSPIGIWFSPSLNNKNDLNYIGRLYDDRKFYHYRLNISGDLKVSTQAMIDDTCRLLGI